MPDSGSVQVSLDQGIASVEFHHPKKNSLPAELLRRLAEEVKRLADEPEARVLVLRSRGDGPFCAGASFDELTSIRTANQGKEFFMGFARLILAMKECPKFVLARIQGKAVGGGVGLAAAADYALAHQGAAVKLSELALGIGPFVVGPCVARKLGHGGFAAMAIDAGWRDAGWAKARGLYCEVFESAADLDSAIEALARKLAGSSPEAMAQLKKALWHGTEQWDSLLEERAEMSGELVLSDFTARAIAAFKKQRPPR